MSTTRPNNGGRAASGLPNPARIGYGRISTRDQHPEAQHDALDAAGCDRIYTDVASSKLDRRPELERVKELLRQGDTLVITRLDRLGRSVKELATLGGDLDGREVNLVVLEQSIDTTTPEGRLFFHMLAAFAEFERDLIVERTREGLAAAKARGRIGGRSSKLSAHQVEAIAGMLAERNDDGSRRYTVQYVADEFRVSRPTIYNAISGGYRPRKNGERR